MSIYFSADLQYSSMTSDEYDNVTSSTTTSDKNRAKKPKLINVRRRHADSKDFDDDEEDTDGISSNFAKKKLKKKQLSDVDLTNVVDNELLYEAMLIKKVDYMIEFACKHCCNRKNIELMEWSEAVLIQLCDTKTKTDFNPNIWKFMKTFVLDNQWALPISYNIQKYTSAFKSLAQILEENHQFKLKAHNLNSAAMFIKIPIIRYEVLQKYKIDSHKIAVPNKFPDLKLKIK